MNKICSLRDIADILLKMVLNTNQSINHAILYIFISDRPLKLQ
jgi:hypothetical protein